MAEVGIQPLDKSINDRPESAETVSMYGVGQPARQKTGQGGVVRDMYQGADAVGTTVGMSQHANALRVIVSTKYIRTSTYKRFHSIINT